jgi:Fe-S oxidoreductase
LASGAEAVITANVGCAMQIQRCARQLGSDLAIYHPAEILAQALGLPRDFARSEV